VIGLEDIDYDIAFRSGDYDGSGDRQVVIVEAVIPAKNDIASQMRLDKLHGPSSLKAAVETDQQLTSRWQDDQTVLAGQPAACDDLRVRRYRGQTRSLLQRDSGGIDVILAHWEIEVLT
jgi:hypothetical protein